MLICCLSACNLVRVENPWQANLLCWTMAKDGRVGVWDEGLCCGRCTIRLKALKARVPTGTPLHKDGLNPK